jgi:hypothetical protein
MTLVTSAFRYLMASEQAFRLVQYGVIGADPPGGAFANGWIFSGDLTGDPYRTVEGTGKCAVVLYTYDASQMHTMRYPRLHMAIYADASRTPGTLSPTTHDAQAKAEQVFTALNPLFHDPANRVRSFDGLRVLSTLQGGAFSLSLIPSGDGSIRGDVVYDVTLG